MRMNGPSSRSWMRHNGHRSSDSRPRAVADAAAQFNTEAYRSIHSGVGNVWMPLDRLTERTEVLAELWLDLATAHEG